MEIIPLIKIKNRKIFGSTIEEIILDKDKIFTDKKIYILDFDGIEKNKPNICTYQKLGKHYDLWVDFSPKDLGDVVDSFMSGARSVIVREKHYKNFNPINIKEISENNVFLFIDEKKNDLIENNDYIDGYISFKNREESSLDFSYSSLLKSVRAKLYVYEEKPENKKYWEKQDIKGLLVDIENIKEFN